MDPMGDVFESMFFQSQFISVHETVSVMRNKASTAATEP